MSVALLFSGQGAQHPDMLPWLAQDQAQRHVEPLIGADWRERLKDRAWAGTNRIAQLLLTGSGLAAWRQLAPLLPTPAAVAGYSVGELAAFAAAGVYDVETAMRLAQQRALLMDRDAGVCPTGLLGVRGLTAEALARLCAEFELAIAIRNSLDSVVLGGPKPPLAAAASAVTERGGHSTVLNVNVASHTIWMRDAAQAFASFIQPIPFCAPRTLVFSNAIGRVIRPAQLKQALSEQIDHTVRWDECMDDIASRNVDCVVEIGPGQALARLWNQRHTHIPARSVDEFRSAQAIDDWVARWSA